MKGLPDESGHRGGDPMSIPVLLALRFADLARDDGTTSAVPRWLRRSRGYFFVGRIQLAMLR